MRYVALNDQEIKVVQTIFDIALKHPTMGGLNVAEAAAILNQKIQSGIPEEQVKIKAPKPAKPPNA